MRDHRRAHERPGPKAAVVLCAYDPTWPNLYEREAALIAQTAGEILKAIHHIGSNSIPGLAAKPIIDIMAVVSDFEKLDRDREQMASIGCIWMGEFGIADRRYFKKPAPGSGRDLVHVHAYHQGHPEIRRHLLFRDYLRGHPQAAQQYGELKETLKKTFPTDVERYAEAKRPFVESIIKAALSVGPLEPIA